MNPPQTLLDKLSGFVGYGPENAKVIFIGIEEKTWDDRETSYKRRLELQAGLEPYKDLGKLCDLLIAANLYNPQRPKDARNPKPQPTWDPLCSIMLGIDGKPDQMDDDRSLFEYQMSKLGRIPGDTLLAELLPVPKSSMKSFGDIHRRLLDLPSEMDVDAYQKRVIRRRRDLLADMLRSRFAGDTSAPRLVIAYGRLWRGRRPWGQFESIFEQALGLTEYNKSDLHFEWAKRRNCLFVLTYHPCPQDKNDRWKFDRSVAKQIVEIYKAQIGS